MNRLHKGLLALATAATVAAGAAYAQNAPLPPQQVLAALWQTCFMDAWVNLGSYRLTCVAEEMPKEVRQ